MDSYGKCSRPQPHISWQFSKLSVAEFKIGGGWYSRYFNHSMVFRLCLIFLFELVPVCSRSSQENRRQNDHFSIRSTEYFLCTSASLIVGGRIVSMSISASAMCITIFGPVNKQLTSSSERLRVSGSGVSCQCEIISVIRPLSNLQKK